MEAFFNIDIPEAFAVISGIRDCCTDGSTTGEDVIIEHTTDRIIAMHLCDDILKRHDAPKPYSVEFNAALIKEMASIGKPALQYLVASELNEDMKTKLSIGIVTLLSLSILNSKWLDWVMQHEDTMFAAALALVPDIELERRLDTYMKNPKGSGKYLQFATSEEILKYPGYLNENVKYVKVHFASFTDKLCQINIDDFVVDNVSTQLKY